MTGSDSAVARTVGLDDKYLLESGEIFLTGVQALVRVPLDQHRADRRRGLSTATFLSGYPGSPVGGFDLELQRRRALFDEYRIVHQMGVNEELGATAVMGSQLAAQLPGPRYDGVVGMWYGKANGMDRALDAFRQANLCGTTPNGGVLACVGDDLMAKSSPTPGASEFSAAAVYMPILYPGDVQEVIELGLHGIAMSRCSGLWSLLKMATTVADGSGTARVAPDLVEPVMVSAELDGRPYLHVPSAHLYGDSVLALERSLISARIGAALAYGRANALNRVTVRGPADRLGIIAAGKTYYDVRQALAELGLAEQDLSRLGIRLLHLKMPYPLDPEVVREFGQGLEQVLVIEDKRPFIELFVKDALYGLERRPAVIGERDEHGAPLVPVHGELDSDQIARLLAPRLLAVGEIPDVRARLSELEGRVSPPPAPMARSPYFCSGCPHSTSVANTPAGATVGAGTGCHVLAVFMPNQDVGDIIGLTAMGNEGAQWIGAAPFVELDHLFQNLGDGTYAHSGSLAIRAAVAAKVNVTYKLLYNDHVAMTGAQPAIGIMAVPRLAQELLIEGVARVIVTTEDLDRYRGVEMPAGVEVWDRDRILEAQEILAQIPGTTVLIHDQECAAEKRRLRKRGEREEPATRIVINERICEGCGDCGEQSNCLSVQPVETEFGRKTRIHQPSCNKDYVCAEGDCPAFISVIPGERVSGPAPPADLDAEQFPAPVSRLVGEECALRITGIGGTGVVTVAQTLATAALLEGKFVRGLDQTGLAQKGGPVVSDLRIGPRRVEVANKLAGADCDLYLACDLLVGAQSNNLRVADPGRTIAVLSTARVPSGQMVADTALRFPALDVLTRRIDRVTRAGEGAAFDAQYASRELFGTDQVANIMLVGAAHQSGALPLGADAIERAIELNGAAVALNLQAFRRGRQFVADPAAFARVLEGRGGAGRAPAGAGAAPLARLSRAERRVSSRVRCAAGSELERVVGIRVHELRAYQNLASATRYADRVERVRAAEQECRPDSTRLAEATARYLHKLMAYKDEYEVARLALDDGLRAQLHAEYGTDTRIAIKLHPPLLRALGLRRKLDLGDWFRPVLVLLAVMRRLRGTPWDIFGYAHVRRVERELITEYEQLLEEIVAGLSPDNHDLAVELAELPDLIRGYEEIKLANVERYHRRLAELRPRLLADALVVSDVA